MPADPVKPSARRPGIYARGTAKVDLILKAALDVLIDEGASAFSLRRIAARCGMTVGNLSYHFPRKDVLVQLMLEEMLDSYEVVLDSGVRQPGLSPRDRLERIVTLCLDDIMTKRTTHLFTELWALANHDQVIAERVESFYRRVHAIIGDFVQVLNPALAPQDVRLVALYISASMEGTTPFLGHGKPWQNDMPVIRSIAVKALVDLAVTITSADMHRDSDPQPFMLRK
ncbi:TetR/AcrR family transcriptional regulator [Sphingobium algorifonticola]|uniref:TetR family transcriptional regulator n=1 Tax=Sphingobium algorifonticola TaxID=2008318 RepID=A0A437J792_9SPHN|nr:TetR/AcrR family transcriptional regulator [Sphingobium algorifonticola]RVT41053.1 TetR family transcriptional regulator [Sphingobium algorifonticola]